MIKGRWPSGKAQVFGTCMRRFESYPPCLLHETKRIACNNGAGGFEKGTLKIEPTSLNRKVFLGTT